MFVCLSVGFFLEGSCNCFHTVSYRVLYNRPVAYFSTVCKVDFVYRIMQLHDGLPSFGSSKISGEMNRGGTQRKRARAEAAAGVDPRNVAGTSKLVALLLHYWSWGFLWLPFVQKIAFAAAADLRAAGGADMEE